VGEFCHPATSSPEQPALHRIRDDAAADTTTLTVTNVGQSP
jgi:hypothetical protein